MGIKLCTQLASVGVQYLPAISETTTPADFEQIWQGLNPGMAVSLGCKGGLHSMALAAQAGNNGLVRHLYERDLTLLNLGDEDGWTPLLHAVYDGKPKTVKLLLHLGADPNLTPVRTFVKAKIRIPIAATCLWLAAQCIRNVIMTKLLLKYGAELSPTLDGEGQSVLSKAKAELTEERAPLTQTITSVSSSSLPSTIIQIIVEYV